MAADLDRDTIYLGTQTVLRVAVAGSDARVIPVVAAVDGLQIARQGSPSQIIFNGVLRYDYRFLVTPQRAGDFVIPTVTLGSGPDMLTQGPFTLHVLEAPLKYVTARVDPPELRVGERATLTVAFQGYRPGMAPVLPVIDGLALRYLHALPLEVTRDEGLPVTKHQVEIRAARLGTYPIKGLTLDGVAADPIDVNVLPFVIAQTRVGETALSVGERTRVQLAIRGLPTSTALSLVTTPGITATLASRPTSGPAESTVFEFNVTAKDIGAPAITGVKLPDGTQAPLPQSIVFSVRAAGEAGLLEARGTARSAQTVIGEPFIVDYEVFFRGDLQAAGVDISQATFGNRPDIKVAGVDPLSYTGWTGQPCDITLIGQGQMKALLGAGELGGRKEQLLRFALKITPLAAGELELKGVRAVVRLRVTRSGPGMFMQSTQDYARSVDVPAHRVMDPPGKTPPPGYRGAVGSTFSFVTALDRTTATALSPLTLTLQITGDSVSPQFKPPALIDVPELTRDFDVSPTVSGGEVEQDTITFTQVIRPRRESIKELPALPLVYYDYVKQDYQTTYSLPIPITVTPGGLVDATDMQAGAGAEASAPTSRAAQAGGAEAIALGANHTTLGAVVSDAPLSVGAIIAVLLSGPLIIVGIWAGRGWRARQQPLNAVRRQRRELVAALEGVAGRADFYVALAELVQAYLRLTFDLPPGEIAAVALAAAMDRRQVDADVRRRVDELLARCDAGRFTALGAGGGEGAAAEMAQGVEAARQLFVALDRC